MVNGVEVQPLAAQVRRVVETLDYLGAPLSAEEKRLLGEASANGDSAAARRDLSARPGRALPGWPDHQS